MSECKCGDRSWTSERVNQVRLRCRPLLALGPRRLDRIRADPIETRLCMTARAASVSGVRGADRSRRSHDVPALKLAIVGL